MRLNLQGVGIESGWTVPLSYYEIYNELCFDLLRGDDDGIFYMESQKGEITVAKSEKLNFENVRRFDLTVQIADNFGLKAQTSIIVVSSQRLS